MKRNSWFRIENTWPIHGFYWFAFVQYLSNMGQTHHTKDNIRIHKTRSRSSVDDRSLRWHGVSRRQPSFTPNAYTFHEGLRTGAPLCGSLLWRRRGPGCSRALTFSVFWMPGQIKTHKLSLALQGHIPYTIRRWRCQAGHQDIEEKPHSVEHLKSSFSSQTSNKNTSFARQRPGKQLCWYHLAIATSACI